jgi:glycosyl transferase, family 25
MASPSRRPRGKFVENRQVDSRDWQFLVRVITGHSRTSSHPTLKLYSKQEVGDRKFVFPRVYVMQADRRLPPICVLNMKRSVERRKRITAHLDGLGLPFELIEAVDGRTLSPRDQAAVYSSREALIHTGRELTPGEIGCSLSHLAVYRKMIDEGWDEVVILEDDAVVDPAFIEILSQRGSLPRDWDLVLLCQNRPVYSFWGGQRLGRFRCSKLASVSLSTAGYLIRRSGGQKLLAHGTPVRVPADYLTGGTIRAGVRLYGINPACVRVLSTDAADSTMPETAALFARWPTKAELGPVWWFVHRCKWRLIDFYRGVNPLSIV